MLPEIARRLARAAERVAASRELIARSRELIRLWRRRHPRIAGAAGEPMVRVRVRKALRDGTLSRVDGSQSWVGYGTGHLCHICAEVITSGEIEHEVVDGNRPVLVHAPCLRVWREESRTRKDTSH